MIPAHHEATYCERCAQLIRPPRHSYTRGSRARVVEYIRAQGGRSVAPMEIVERFRMTSNGAAKLLRDALERGELRKRGHAEWLARPAKTELRTDGGER